jgi:Tfp pilus assembly protein PilO
MEKMRQWTLLTGVAVVAVFALGWFMLISPQRSHVATLHAQTTAQNAANASLQSQVAQLQQQSKGMVAQQYELNKLAQKIPVDPQLPSLIRQVVAAAQTAGVDLVSIAPGQPALVAGSTPTTTTPAATAPAATGTAGAPTGTAGAAAAPSAQLAAIPVTLTVSGSYYNVLGFFNALEKLKRAMTVQTWSLNPVAPSNGSSTTKKVAPGTLSGTLNAQVFEAPPPAAASAPSVTAAQ